MEPAKALWQKETWNLLETEKKPMQLDRRGEQRTDRKLGGGQGWAREVWERSLIFISRANTTTRSVLTGNPTHKRGEVLPRRPQHVTSRESPGVRLLD